MRAIDRAFAIVTTRHSRQLSCREALKRAAADINREEDNPQGHAMFKRAIPSVPRNHEGENHEHIGSSCIQR
jgi:hypothetical protein